MDVDAPMDALLGSLGLPHQRERSAWKAHAGWQPRYIALQDRENGGAPSKTRAILTAIPAEMKPLVDRAILAAAEAAAASRPVPSVSEGTPQIISTPGPLSKPLWPKSRPQTTTMGTKAA